MTLRAASSAAIRKQRVAPAADGHSSGSSGSGHLSPPESPPEKATKREPAALARAANKGSKTPAKAYELRTRSSSLRVASSEDAVLAEAATPASDAADDSGDEDMGHSGSEQDEEEQEPGAGGVPRKRVGRPLAYSGDPDAPHLTDLERRKIKRRIANRESARRVRAKRAELMDELQMKATTLGRQNARLLAHVALVESHKTVLAQQVGLLQEKLAEKAHEALHWYNQMVALRKVLPAEVQPVHDAGPPPDTPVPRQDASLFVPVVPHKTLSGDGSYPSSVPRPSFLM